MKIKQNLDSEPDKPSPLHLHIIIFVITINLEEMVSVVAARTGVVAAVSSHLSHFLEIRQYATKT